MSLLKIPLIIIVWWANMKGMSAPRPPQQMRKKPSGIPAHLRLEKKLTVWNLPLLNRAVLTLLMLIDVTFTYVDNRRSSILEHHILHNLCRDKADDAHSYISSLFLLGMIISVAAGALRLACYHTLGQLFVFEVSIHREHKLITTGPYSIVRHPSYTALVLLQVGAMLTVMAPGSWWAEAHMAETRANIVLTAFWVALTIYRILICARVGMEDSMLKKTFGKEWEEYASRVKYWFIPGIL